MSAISGYSSNSYAQSMASLREQTFKTADSSGDNSIDSTEFADFLSKGPDGSSVDASAMFTQFDTNNDGGISADEMDTGMKNLRSQMESTMNQMRFGNEQSSDARSGASGKTHGHHGMKEMFSKADTSGDGSVDSTEFADLLSKGPQADSVNAKEAFAKYDTNGDGTLSKNEFSTGMKDLMASMPPPPPSGGKGGSDSLSSSSASSSNIMSSLDTDGDGVIDTNELTSGLSNTKVQKMLASYLQQISSSYSTQTSSLLTSVSA